MDRRGGWEERGRQEGAPTSNPTNIMGAFSHSAGTAPMIMLFIPGTPLKTTHLQKDA